MTTRGLYAHAASGLSPACSGSGVDAQRDPHRLKAGKWRGAAVSVEMAAAVWNKPEAPAVTAGASSLVAPLPVGLIRRFPRTARGARQAPDYSGNLTRKVKVLDFIKSGGLEEGRAQRDGDTRRGRAEEEFAYTTGYDSHGRV